MTCIRIPNGIICVNTSPIITFVVEGKKVRVEHDSWPGAPWVLRQDGEIAARQPGGKHPFWSVYGAWQRQGKRVDADGNAVVDEEGEQ